jgi:hypothetical protein
MSGGKPCFHQKEEGETPAGNAPTSRREPSGSLALGSPASIAGEPGRGRKSCPVGSTNSGSARIESRPAVEKTQSFA